jgi:hypothetical protein
MNRVVVFEKGLPRATAPMQKVNLKIAELERYIQINMAVMKVYTPNMTDVVCAKIAYLRVMAIREGLVSPDFVASQHNVRYNEAVELNDVQVGKLVIADKKVYQTVLTKKVRDELRVNFANIVGTVAYMFRVRGHHYLDDMRDKYENVWGRCLKGSVNPGVEWRVIAHDALHAIYPDILDNYWKMHVDNGTLAGTLILRYNSAPAGVAAVRVVYAGAEDLRMAIPGIVGKFQKHFTELDAIVDTLRADRWRGSINRRFYGAGSVEFDEQKFGAIASVVWNCLLAFAANSPLLKSKALERVAMNAPITGGLIARSIMTVASDPALVKGMLILEPVRE